MWRGAGNLRVRADGINEWMQQSERIQVSLHSCIHVVFPQRCSTDICTRSPKFLRAKICKSSHPPTTTTTPTPFWARRTTEYRGMPERRIQLSAPLLPAERPCEFIKGSQWERQRGHRRMWQAACVEASLPCPASLWPDKHDNLCKLTRITTQARAPPRLPLLLI